MKYIIHKIYNRKYFLIITFTEKKYITGSFRGSQLNYCRKKFLLQPFFFFFVFRHSIVLLTPTTITQFINFQDFSF